MKGQVTGIWVLIVESTKKTDQVCGCSKWKTPMPARYIKSTFWTIGIFIQSTDARERERELAWTRDGRFSLIIATSSNVNSRRNSRRGYGAWLWDKCYYLLSEVVALGIQVGRRPGQDPLDTTLMSIETHRQEEIREMKIEECLPSAHKLIRAFMWIYNFILGDKG